MRIVKVRFIKEKMKGRDGNISVVEREVQIVGFMNVETENRVYISHEFRPNETDKGQFHSHCGIPRDKIIEIVELEEKRGGK